MKSSSSLRQKGADVSRRWSLVLRCLALLTLALMGARAARADADLLLEEPINFLGDVTSTGHAELYVRGLCTDNLVSVRACRADEAGAVIGRYPGTREANWIAMPPQAYFYGVEQPADVPASITQNGYLGLVNAFREQYAQTSPLNLNEAAWVQLVGASYRREIIMVHLNTTAAEDERLMNWLNARQGRSRFNFFFNNCADFVREMLNVVHPGSVHRNMLFDAGFTTPKQLAVGLHRYSLRHPDVDFKLVIVPQIAGTMPRSTRLYGVTESLAKTKWYLLPAVVAAPIPVGTVYGLGWIDHRYNAPALARYAPALSPDEVAWLPRTISETP